MLESASYLENVPDSLKGRVALVDGTLHMSAELKGNLDMLAYFGRIRKRGVRTHEFHDPKKFDTDYANLASRSYRGENAIQQYGIDLLTKAYDSGATDIHLIDYGPYTLIQFRCLGMLSDHTHLEGDFGRKLITCIYQTLGQSGDACFSPSERQDGRICKRDFLPQQVNSVRVHCEPIECALSVSGVGTSMSLRLLYDSTAATGDLATRMARLGFTPSHCETAQFLTRRTGLTVVSGPTGHGKTTLLKHIMESMCERNPEKAFFSLEDPPEYPLKDVPAISRQAQAAMASSV